MRMGLFVFCLLTTLFFYGCKPEKAAKIPPPPVVKTVEVFKGPYTPATDHIARVQAWKSVELVARVPGFLTERNFVEGSYVKAGTLLYVIEPPPYQIARQQAEAQLAQAQALAFYADTNFKRIQKLYHEEVSDADEFDQAKSDQMAANAKVQLAQAELAQAELNLSYTKILAPFDGWIGLTAYDVGNYLDASSRPLNSLQFIDRVRVSVNIAETSLTAEQIGMLQRGQKPDLTVTMSFRDGTPYDGVGTLEYWNNQIAVGTGTLQLQALFENPLHRLIPGQYVTVRIAAKEPQEVLLLNELAIHDDEGGSYVFVIDAENRAVAKRITHAGKVGDNAIITSGLAAGDRAVAAATRLANNMKVVISTEPLK